MAGRRENPMLTDIEIAQSTKLRPIADVAGDLGIQEKTIGILAGNIR